MHGILRGLPADVSGVYSRGVWYYAGPCCTREPVGLCVKCPLCLSANEGL